MTGLNQIALEFCRECMDMRTPAHNPAILERDVPSVYGHIAGDSSRFANFRYTDLNAVMEAVSEWCSKRGLFLSTRTTPTLGEVSAQVFDHALRAEVCHCEFA